MEDEKILKKIAACLRLAKSSNANEAATALRQAQTLMEKHNITAEDVAVSDVSESKVSIGVKSRPNQWCSNLAGMIDRAFGTDHISQRHWHKSTECIFIGVAPAPEIAAYAFSVLHRQLKKERSAFYKSLGKRGLQKNRIKRANLFAEHWVYNVYSTVKKFAGNDNNEIIQKFKDKQYGELSTYNPNGGGDVKTDADWNAVHKGRKASDGVTLNHAMSGDHKQRQLS